jgi:hypothetical protein
VTVRVEGPRNTVAYAASDPPLGTWRGGRKEQHDELIRNIRLQEVLRRPRGRRAGLAAIGRVWRNDHDQQPGRKSLCKERARSNRTSCTRWTSPPSMGTDYLPDYVVKGGSRTDINTWCRTISAGTTTTQACKPDQPAVRAQHFQQDLTTIPRLNISAGKRFSNFGIGTDLPFQAGPDGPTFTSNGFRRSYPGPNPGTVARTEERSTSAEGLFRTRSIAPPPSPSAAGQGDGQRNSSDGSVWPLQRQGLSRYFPAGYNYRGTLRIRQCALR